MDPAWRSEFYRRMRSFELDRPRGDGSHAVSIKVRVVSGCFHYEHSRHAYALIERQLAAAGPGYEFSYIEHESGPEILAWIALGTAGVTLARSVIDLVAAIINGRSDGIAKGDRPSDPVELIVRRVGNGDSFVEETILKIGHKDIVTPQQIEELLKNALQRLLAEEDKTSPKIKKKAQKAP